MLLLHIILHVNTVLLYYHKHFVIISLYSKAKKYLVQPKLWPVLSARTKRHPTIKAQRPGKYKRARTTEDERQFVLDAILANNQHRLRVRPTTIVTVHQCCRLRWHLRKSSCSNWLRDVINSNDKVVTLLFASAPS